MPHLATILITILLSLPAMSVEVFRYRGAAKDGGTLEYAIRSLSEILGLSVLVPNDHGVPRIDYRYVERAVVFTLGQKLRLIL